MVMPERSFGRTVRYRRNKLGLSQANLAELVGRSTPTIRSWERDKTRPNDPQVIATLAAILGVDERQLFEKAEVDLPVVTETSPTVEQALATLSVESAQVEGSEGIEVDLDLADVDDETRTPTPIPVPVSVEQYRLDLVAVDGGSNNDGAEVAPVFSQPRRERVLVAAGAAPGPAYVAPPEPYVQTPVTQSLSDASYIEDASQRQLYRVRNLATFVAAVALVVAFIWAMGEGIGALTEWWDDFFGNLRL